MLIQKIFKNERYLDIILKYLIQNNYFDLFIVLNQFSLFKDFEIMKICSKIGIMKIHCQYNL